VGSTKMKRYSKSLVMCVDNQGYTTSLIKGNVYRCLSDIGKSRDGMIRVIKA
jgi:hypothetical protein